MSTTTLAPTPLEQEKKAPPPLLHFFCPCQRHADPSLALCGMKLGGPTQSSKGIPPMQLCVICGDYRTDERPCPYCGRAVDAWPS
jgi:hypothetical protein